MKRLVLMMTAIFALGGTHLAAKASPADDLIEYQAYFARTFTNVKFDDFSKGYIVLPKMQEYAAQWDQTNQWPPHETTVDEGMTLWKTPFTNGKTFASCFKNGGKNIAQYYPYWDNKSQKVRIAEMDLLDCMKRNDPAMAEKFSNLKNDGIRVQFAGLVGAFYSLSKGQKVEIDISTPGALAAYEAGKKYWWSRRGQLNFSCASCHVQMVGKNLGGNQPLSAGLGHPLGWPAYRGLWERLEILHYRYQTCDSQARAKPNDLMSEAYNNLQLYETYMSSGLPLTAPSYRGY